jgi:hypothetical protein
MSITTDSGIVKSTTVWDDAGSKTNGADNEGTSTSSMACTLLRAGEARTEESTETLTVTFLSSFSSLCPSAMIMDQGVAAPHSLH